jgi:hypothetical protein
MASESVTGNDHNYCYEETEEIPANTVFPPNVYEVVNQSSQSFHSILDC